MIPRPRSNRSIARFGALCTVAILTAGTLGGCSSLSGRTADRHTYDSTTWSPKTVSLIDTRTGETAWSVDVPVGQAIRVVFSEGSGPNEYLPDEIRWELAPIGRRIVTPTNFQPCPPAHARRLDLSIRETPEATGTNPDPRWNERSDYED